MADTTNLGITKPTPGGDAGTWGATLNTGSDGFDTAVAGTLSKSVAGSANVSLTDAEALNANHIYTGELTGNIAVHVPIKSRRYQVFNNTTGSFTLKVKTSSETNGTTIGQGETLVLMCDGTSVISGVTGAAATSVSDFTTNNLKVLTCASATNLVAATGSFTTKVSGVAAEFSGHVSAAEFYGGGANITGITAPTSVDEYKVNELTVVSLAHVEKGDAGSVTANALADELVIENSDHAGLSILTPADKHGYVMFGDPGSNSAGQIQYDHGTPAWQYIFEGSNRMYFNSTETVFNDGGGNFDFRIEGDTTTSLFKVDADQEKVEVGGTLSLADNTVSRPNLLDYGEVTNAIGSTGGGTQDIDLTAGNSVSATVDTSANTFTFSNPTASDEMCGFVLTLTNGGSQTVNWPASVDWAGGTAPTLTTAGVDVLVFYTIDGGTKWHGMIASTDSK